MGRNRLPTAVQDAKGYFEHNPDRFPEGSEALEEAAPLDVPPARLDEDHRDIWREIVIVLVPGVLKVSDAWAFESMVRLIFKEQKGTIEIGERGQLIKLYSLFGMTPADRSKIQVEKKPQSAITKFLTNKKC
jgi:phage terminase small subunit